MAKQKAEGVRCRRWEVCVDVRSEPIGGCCKVGWLVAAEWTCFSLVLRCGCGCGCAGRVGRVCGRSGRYVSDRGVHVLFFALPARFFSTLGAGLWCLDWAFVFDKLTPSRPAVTAQSGRGSSFFLFLNVPAGGWKDGLGVDGTGSSGRGRAKQEVPDGGRMEKGGGRGGWAGSAMIRARMTRKNLMFCLESCGGGGGGGFPDFILLFFLACP